MGDEAVVVVRQEGQRESQEEKGGVGPARPNPVWREGAFELWVNGEGLRRFRADAENLIL